MAAYYPVFLDLKDKHCVIIGGGKIGEHKIRPLLDCGAKITVISPEVTEGIQEAATRGDITLVIRKYNEGDLKGAALAIAATNVRSVNKGIASEAERERVVLNVVDDAELCTFIAPAIVKKGAVTVALSTGGASPALARKLREGLENSEALEYAELAGVLSTARKELRQRGITVDPDRWQECITGDLIDLVKAGRDEAAVEKVLAGLTQSTG